MTTTRKPATPLPWTAETMPEIFRSKMRDPEYREKVQRNEGYKLHAANAYPRLVAALREICALEPGEDAGRNQGIAEAQFYARNALAELEP